MWQIVEILQHMLEPVIPYAATRVSRDVNNTTYVTTYVKVH